MSEVNILRNTRSKLANSRNYCTGLSEEVYLLADYMSLHANLDFTPTNMFIHLLLALDDFRSNKCTFPGAEHTELSCNIIKYRRRIISEAMMFSLIVDAISDEEFSNEFRKILKVMHHWEIPNKVSK